MDENHEYNCSTELVEESDKAYRNLDFYKDQVVVNTTTAHSAGDAIENKILASA